MKAVGILVIAAAVALGTGCTSRPAAGPQRSPTPSPTAGTASPTATVTVSPTATVPTPTSTAGPPGGPVPKGFSPASVTFVSLQTGWALGATCPTCTVSVLRTRDGGKSWASIPAPPASLAPDGGAGVRKVRFADLNNGWAFDPDLWVTHDGGAHWIRSTLPVGGPPGVSDLAVAGGLARAVVFGTTNAFQIYTTLAGQDAWVASPTRLPVGAGPVPTAQIVLQGGSGWVIQNDRVVVNGARLAGGAWVPWQPPCANPSVGGPAVLAASTPTDLVAACSEGRFSGPAVDVRVFLSANGVTFTAQGTVVPSATDAQGVASPVPGTLVVADAARLAASFDRAATWTTVFSGTPSGGWQDLGFTSPTQGVVVEAGQGTQPGVLLMTHDGGHSWVPVPFTG
ncbi:MAG TPA: hypothetical protein VG779_08985 [Actinomycetota bacterium]|nr:hypothetical protein [Actinomycetota bacterium]